MYTIKHLKQILKQNDPKRLLLITAAVVTVLTAAVCFIYLYGNSQNTSILLQSSAEAAQEEDSAGTAASISDGKGTDDDPGSMSEESNGQQNTIFVDISGCVKAPGVYELPYGSRIFEVVEKAGGFTKHADTALINQAERAADGMKINVPDKRNTEASGPVAPGTSDDKTSGGTKESSSDSMININTAGSDELQQLPGIGPVTAEKIIQYRESNGPFSSADDITNVSGIGEKTLQKIKSRITV